MSAPGNAFVLQWERVIRWCAVGMVLRFPDLAADEDDLVQVGRIAISRRRHRIDRIEGRGLKCHQVKRDARTAMHQYLATWRGWRKGAPSAATTRGPARLRTTHEGSDSLVWEHLAIESPERRILEADMRRRVRTLAPRVLTQTQIRAFFADEAPTEWNARQVAHQKLLLAVQADETQKEGQ